MNRCTNSWKSALAIGLSAAWATVMPVTAGPAAQPDASPAAIRSVFVIPSSPNEGRDPFFPSSTRPYEIAAAGKPHVGDVSSLILKGISGPTNRRLAIINNRTLAVGDEQDLVTPQGRIHIRCVEIKNNSVVIESAGSNHELKYNDNP